MINPLGNFIGAIIMFWVLGFVPCYIIARVLKAVNLLRIPREIELVGLDSKTLGDPYPYIPYRETAFDRIERDAAKRQE
jgi:hypothetical protein